MNLHLQLLFLVAVASYQVAFAEAFGYVAYNESSRCVAYEALPSCFGPQLPAEGLRGYMMRVIPPNACHAIQNPPTPRDPSETYIALIQGCDCPFVEKVLHAQQAGYHTAVVYNVNSEHLTTMRADDKKIQQLIKIPSLFTGQSVSLHLQRTSHHDKGAYISLLPPKHYWQPCLEDAKMLQETFILQDFRSIFCIIVATFSVVAVLGYYKKRSQIKLHTYKLGDKYESCVICMTDYKEGDSLKILSCSHAYHSACIDTWFHTQPNKKTCPFCKQAVSSCVQGDIPAEQAGEDQDEEQQADEDVTFSGGHEDEHIEEEKEEKDNASTVEEDFEAPLEL
ncbi:E3 ubiquitin-protein ligase RNF13-like [Calypte anna]|uniref:E3 ubiquitin-protein ligase RNF13-like n=1 Tax=Calypte anna TaxID=9244 RepID=UPI0011C35816|nr:E3 ubiquitin-protein ligase RNF13-like [Calypte anna]